MERVHSRESVQQREAVKASTSREKSPTSAVQRRESWRERSKSPGSRRASRTSRLDSEDNNVNGGALLDQSSTGDPTKPLSPSLRRRRFHERKVPIARRSSSMSIGDPTDTYRAVRPFKSVDHAYGGAVDDNREKKTIMVTDLDHAEVEMSKASRSTPNLSDLTEWTSGNNKKPFDYNDRVGDCSQKALPLPASQTVALIQDVSSSAALKAELAIEESEAKIVAAVEDIECVFDDAMASKVQPTPVTPTPVTIAKEKIETKVGNEEALIKLRDVENVDSRNSVDVVETPSQFQAEGDNLMPSTMKNPLKSASASQVRFYDALH